MVADAMSNEEILAEHPDLELADISEALRYAALALGWCVDRQSLAGNDDCSIVATSCEEADMAITTVTSREFNQDVGRAKRAAASGPVFVTDRGRPSLVLVTYEDWLRLSGKSTSIAEALTGTLDAAEVEFDPVPDRTLSAGAEFD